MYYILYILHMYTYYILCMLYILFKNFLENMALAQFPYFVMVELRSTGLSDLHSRKSVKVS